MVSFTKTIYNKWTLEEAKHIAKMYTSTRPRVNQLYLNLKQDSSCEVCKFAVLTIQHVMFGGKHYVPKTQGIRDMTNAYAVIAIAVFK